MKLINILNNGGIISIWFFFQFQLIGKESWSIFLKKFNIEQFYDKVLYQWLIFQQNLKQKIFY